MSMFCGIGLKNYKDNTQEGYRVQASIARWLVYNRMNTQDIALSLHSPSYTYLHTPLSLCHNFPPQNHHTLSQTEHT